MTLDKAIELNEDTEKSLRDHKFIDYADAVKLLIEAGKRLRSNRNFSSDIDLSPLPGEDPQ